jgi:hypothetical protein
MNDFTLHVNSTPPAGDTPTSAEQTLLDKFLALPTRQQQLYLHVLHHWVQAPPKRRALALKLLDSGLPAKLVAWLCGVSDRTLRRYPEFRTATFLLSGQGGTPLRGAKSQDGVLEAWEG